MGTTRYTPGQVRKAAVAAFSAVLTVCSVILAVGNVLPDGWAKYVEAVIAIGAAFGVYKLPNDPTP